MIVNETVVNAAVPDEPTLGAPLLPVEEIPEGTVAVLSEGATALLSDATSGTTETATETTVIVDFTEVVSALETVNYTLTAILFIVLYSFCEQKIKSGLRRFLKNNE